MEEGALGLAALAFPFACLDWFLRPPIVNDRPADQPWPSFETCIGRASPESLSQEKKTGSDCR